MDVDFCWIDRRVRLSAPAPVALDVRDVLIDFVERSTGVTSDRSEYLKMRPAPLDGPEPIGVRVEQLADGAWSVAPAPREFGSPAVTAVSAASAVAFAELAVVETLVRSGSHRLHLHAAGIPGPDDSVVIALGESGSGKSTLSAVAARDHGLTWGDDILPLRMDGRVDPFPRPLKLHESVLPLLDLDPHGTPGRIQGDPEVWVHPEKLGAVWGPAGARIGGVILTRYSPGAEFHLEELAVSETLALLLGSTHGSAAEPAEALDVMASIAERTPGLRVRYGSAKLALRAIGQRLGTS